MPLTLVLGPANSAKAGEVLGAYAAAARRGALLVVPTALDAEHYGRELAKQGAVVGSVLTFAGLTGEVARRAGYAAVHLSALQRDRVLTRVVRRLRLEVIGESALAPGFVRAAGALIAELQRSLVTPQRLHAALDAWAASDPRRAGYAADVAAIYRAYVRELDELGRVDAELHAWRGLDAMREHPSRWGNDTVFFYGFDDLTALERDAVETLARVVGVEVTVSLTYEPGRTALSARAEVVEELRALATRAQELPPLERYYEPASRGALHHLERSLFEGTEQPIEAGDAVVVLEAGGERAEPELVAGEVLGLLRGGVAPDEIAVVHRTLVRAAAVFEHVFADYGIPVGGRHRTPFTHTPLGRSLRALLRCALWPEDRARAADLLDYLRTPGLLQRPEIADGLEADVLCLGLLSAEQARGRLDWSFTEWENLRTADDRLAETARQARRLFALPHRGQAPILTPGESLDARALAVLLAALEELRELGERLSVEELLDLLDGLEVPASEPARSGAVLMAEPLEVRARRFHAVFVCGLNEGEFPLPGIAEPFLSDDRRRELAIASGLRLPIAEDAIARERYLFYSAVSRARARLYLSYRSSDEEGNVAVPSPFLGDVTELFTPELMEGRRQRLLADVVWRAEGAPTPRERARARAAAQAPAGPMPKRVWVLSETALGRVRHREVVSGGALETFADCPVKWFVERELSPRRLEPDPDPVARGSFMHAALEALMRRLHEPVTSETLPEAEAILDEVLETLPDGIAAGRPASVRAGTMEAIAADLRRYLREEALDSCDWRPEGIELKFGLGDEEDALPAVTLGEGDDQVLLRGVIDRLDVDPDGSGRALVRDYKSGRKRPAHQGGRWREDRQLQVALYMLAVRRLLGLDPVAGLYQPLGGPDLRPRGVFLRDAPVGSRVMRNDGRDREQLDEVLDDAEARALELARRLRTGELTPCPETCSRDGCRYPGICRSS